MLRYSTFNFLRLSSSKMLRSSSVWGRHYLKDLQNIFWSFKLKFKIWVWPKKWLIRYSTFNFLRLSSIQMLRSSSVRDRHYLKDLQNIVWSFNLKFKIWVWSNKWLLRYSTFNFLRLSSIKMLRSSSIGGRLHLKHFLFLIWSPELKFKIEEISCQLCLRYLNLLFQFRLSSFNVFLIFVWSPELKFTIWEISYQWLMRYLDFNILRSSSIISCLHFKHFQFWFGPLSLSLKFEEDPISGCWDN